MSEDNLVIGACDWRHKHWSEDFYPDELPSDWCLGYYSNAFECVLVPAESWQGDSNGCEDWLDEVGENFRFYFELPDELCQSVPGRERFIEQVTLLEDTFGGVLLNEGGSEQAWLRDKLPQAGQLRPSDSGDGFRCYRDDTHGLILVRLSHDLVDKRAARALLEQALETADYAGHTLGGQNQGSDRGVCIVEHAHLKAADLAQMRQIIEIMGL